MNSGRQRKRRRLPTQEVIYLDETDERRVRPEVAASSPGVSSAAGPSVETDRGTSVNEPIPTRNDISRHLQIIENSSSVEESLRSLEKIQKWLVYRSDKNIESPATRVLNNADIQMLVLENLYCYGGITRIMDFMSVNMKDWSCVVAVSSFIADVLSFRWSKKHKEKKVANELAKMFVRCGGVAYCVMAGNLKHSDKTRSSADMKYVWKAIGRALNGEESREIVSDTLTFVILHGAIGCIRQIIKDDKNCPNNKAPWMGGTLEVALYSIANTIKYTSVSKDVLEREEVIEHSIMIMTNYDNWFKNENIATYAMGILFLCATLKDVQIRMNAYDKLLYPLVYCMKNYSDNAPVRSIVLGLLENACAVLPRNRIESSGVLAAISGLLKSGNSGQVTEDKVRDIMRMIIS